MFNSRIANLIAAIVWLSIAVFMGLLLPVYINQYNAPELEYEDVQLKNYTYEKHEFLGRRWNYCYIYVEELEKPLKIQNIPIGEVNRDNLNSLREGDTIYCYVINSKDTKVSYEIVEIGSKDKMILSLDDYNSKHKSNSGLSFIVIPFLSIASLALSIISFVAVKKNRRVLN